MICVRMYTVDASEEREFKKLEIGQSNIEYMSISVGRGREE